MEADAAAQVRVLDEALVDAMRGLRAAGRPEAAGAIRSQLSRGLGAPAEVVVVGEVSRGKSSLVNALAGRRICPDEGGTAAFVRLGPPWPGSALGDVVVRSADGASLPLDGDIGDWVVVGGAHRSGTDGTAPALGVDVAVDLPGLPGAVLVDTPGVGGLEGGHAALASQLAERATVVVLVADAGSRLTTTELGFLESCSRRVDAIVIVLAGTDRHPRSWREVLAEDERLRGAHLPDAGVAGVIGVSSALAAAATAAADPLRADRLAAASGVPQLRTVLADLLARRDVVVRANALRTASTALTVLLAEHQRARAALAGDAEATARLAADEARLAELLAQQERWTMDLNRDLKDAVRATGREIRTVQLDVQQRWEAVIRKQLRAPRGSQATELAAEVRSEIGARMTQAGVALDRRLRDVVRRLYGEDEAALASLDLAFRAELVPDDDRPGIPAPARRLLAGLLPAGAGGGAAGAARLAFGGAAVFALPFVLAPLVTGALREVLESGRSEALTWLRVELDTATRDALDAVQQAVDDLTPELIVHYRQHLAARVAELRATLRDAASAAAPGGERAERLAAADRTIAALDAQLADVRSALSGTSRAPTASKEPDETPAR